MARCNGITRNGNRCNRKVYPCPSCSASPISSADLYCFQHLKFNAEEDCPICFDTLCNVPKIRITTTKCNHNFHKDCLNKWLSKHDSCPCCRTVLKETPPSPPGVLFEDASSRIEIDNFQAILVRLVNEHQRRLEERREEEEQLELEAQREIRQPRNLFVRLFCIFS